MHSHANSLSVLAVLARNALFIGTLMTVGLSCSAPRQDSFLNPDSSAPCVDGSAAGRVCSGRCVDLNTSATHCGRCGFECPSGVDCVAGVCATACRTNYISCMDTCVDPQTNSRFCGASADCAGPNVGRRCSPVEHCVGGTCVYFEAPRSEVSPFAGSGEADLILIPRPIIMTIGSVLSGTIYYTLDGTEPRPGMGSTQSGFNVVSVTVGGAPGSTTTLKWYMDYGGFYGREPSTRQRLFSVTAPPSGAGALYENLRLNGGGPTALVAPNSRVRATLRVQQWSTSPMGYCPTCVIIQWLSADITETEAVGFRGACAQLAVPQWPGEADQEREYTFIAPERPGRYAVRAGQQLDFPASCPRQSRGGTPIAFFYVQ